MERLRPLVPEGVTPAQSALRRIAVQETLSVVIPGVRNASQAHANAATGAPTPLDQNTRRAVQEIYDELIRPQVHHCW
ncbi:hypothetical protein [Kitasatospora sp. NPDC050543]|uniref:hypothetical protein n=1 Tax=Kitasatospora sp. NPDC050543 TaxID=3364054 RepID=UPI0037976651